MDLSALRNAAVTEYFNQPIVDTFDVGICPAFPCVHKVDFRTITESQMAFIDVALHYQINTCTTVSFQIFVHIFNYSYLNIKTTSESMGSIYATG